MDFIYDLFDPEQYSEGTRKNILIAAFSGFTIVSSNYLVKNIQVPTGEEIKSVPKGHKKNKLPSFEVPEVMDDDVPLTLVEVPEVKNPKIEELPMATDFPSSSDSIYNYDPALMRHHKDTDQYILLVAIFLGIYLYFYKNNHKSKL